jgi:DNA-binding CsgD family transcriptional regulator
MAAEVVGREEELAAVREALAQAETGTCAVVIEGDAGIGKTTLWQAGLAAAGELGFRTLVARPAEAETQLSYAGLADLLGSALDEVLVEIPSPQRTALEVALLRSEAEHGAPEQAAIAFGFLSALRALARDRPVLAAVDDAQWLDAASAFALRFATRRLREEPVGLLVAMRTEPAALELTRLLPEERTRRIAVGPLSSGALQHLVQTRLDVVLTRPALQRLHAASGGNPFYAIELARALDERGLQLEPGEPLPVSGHLRELLRDRFAGLPGESERALLFAAAASQPTVALLERAVGKEIRSSLLPAVEEELIEVEGERVRFAHPLLASVVYSDASSERKLDVHRRLAAVVQDPEERARHLALCSEKPDAEVASALDDAARIARGRGAPQAAAELSEQALRLTPSADAEAAHRRRLEAGGGHFEAGNSGRAELLFSEAAEAAPSAARRAESLSRLARVHHYAGDQHVAVRLFRECLADPGTDTSLRADAADGLANSLFFLREELPDAVQHARSAAQLAREQGDEQALAVALGTQGVIEAVLGREESVTTFESALALQESARGVPLVRQPSFQVALSLVWADDFDGARAELENVRVRAVAQGDESSLPFVLTFVSLVELLSGHWQEALRSADEGEEIGLAAGLRFGRAYALSARALVAACLGHEESVRSDAEEALGLAALGAMAATMAGAWAVALLELSLGNPRGAHEALSPLVGHCRAAGIGEPGSMRFVPDEIEALVALGDREAAAEELAWFEELARRLDRRSALAAVHRCRGLLANETDEALAAFRHAADEFEQLSMPFERARTLLALGPAQRRANQRRDARRTLEAALEAFEALGAALWAEQTRAELRRISGRAPSLGALTASEQRVAELVAAGRTNREVAAALYVTPRTVEGTLSRVYSKLGVRSRTELARRWAPPDS